MKWFIYLGWNFKYLIVGVILFIVVILVVYLSVEYMRSKRKREFNAVFRISDSLMQRYHDVKAWWLHIHFYKLFNQIYLIDIYLIEYLFNWIFI